MKKVDGHDIVYVPFLESASKSEKNDTQYHIHFRMFEASDEGSTMQSLNFAPAIQALV